MCCFDAHIFTYIKLKHGRSLKCCESTISCHLTPCFIPHFLLLEVNVKILKVIQVVIQLVDMTLLGCRQYCKVYMTLNTKNSLVV